MNTNYLTTFFDSEVKTTSLLLLSQFSGLVFSPLSLIAPYLIWLSFKDRYSMVDYYAKEILNFSLNMIPWALLTLMLTYFNPFFVATLIIPVALTLVFNIICLIKVSKGQKFHFPYTFKVIKGL